MKNGNLICSECGAILERENYHEFEGYIYCEDCLNEKTVVCMNCNERIWREMLKEIQTLYFVATVMIFLTRIVRTAVD